jgi:hypothetical protein
MLFEKVFMLCFTASSVYRMTKETVIIPCNKYMPY